MTLLNRQQRNHTKTSSLVFALAAALFGSAGCAPVESETILDSEAALGSGQYQQYIRNWTDLTRMTPDGNYLLTVDLNASGMTWIPKDFRGTFDGGGKTISNLTINSTGSGAGFFKNLDAAIVRDVRFTNLRVTDTQCAGGVAATAYGSLIEMVGVQGTISAPGGTGVGGITCNAQNTLIQRSFMRGTVSGALHYAGGITGVMNGGEVFQSYSWATVTADVSHAGIAYAGGVAGSTFSARIQDVYAVGNVKGRGAVGGLVGSLGCNVYFFVLNHGIYRGDLIDADRPDRGGWAGTFGRYDDCVGRLDQLFWDRTRDASTNFHWNVTAQRSATDQELKSPTTAAGGVYFSSENTFSSSIWAAGSSNQHHALQNMPGGLTIQPRCVSSSGVPSAC